MNKKKLKIGVLTDNHTLQRWQFKIIEEIKNSDYASICLIMINGSMIDSKKTFIDYLREFRRIIYNIHIWLDHMFLGRNVDYNEKIKADQLFQDIDNIIIHPVKTGFVDHFRKEDIEIVNSYNLDVILRFGFRIIKGDVLNSAKYGIWSYHHGDNRLFRGTPANYWEFFRKAGVVGCILQILNENPENGIVLHRSWIMADHLSISRSRNNCYWRSTLFVPRILNHLHQRGLTYLNEIVNKNNDDINIYDYPLYRTPTNLIAFKYMIKHIGLLLFMIFRKLFYREYWFVLIGYYQMDRFSCSLKDFLSIKSPRGTYWADPFLLFRDNKYFLLVEEYSYKKKTGYISIAELNSQGTVTRSGSIIKRDYHLSYPFFIEMNDNLYIVPESRANNTIELYKCVDFPYTWEHEMNLMENVSATDTTLFFYKNKWWLFTCIDQTNGKSLCSDELFLFYSDHLITQNWQSHKLNPIITDTRLARPAGKIFFYNNKIYRPSQDCSGIYGRALNLNEIIKINETDYEERLVLKNEPNWLKNIKGIHTFNFNNRFIVTDGFKYV